MFVASYYGFMFHIMAFWSAKGEKTLPFKRAINGLERDHFFMPNESSATTKENAHVQETDQQTGC